MFYNALKRKSYGAKEQDMPTVIPIHNVVNEMCWKKVLEWESLSFQSPEGPKLVKFEGKPTDYTIKARIRQFMGYSLPFDRHDWIVERNGKEIKYIIDFYGGDEGVKGDEVTSNNIGNPSIFLDVRPGLTFDGYVNRIRKYVRDGNGIF